MKTRNLIILLTLSLLFFQPFAIQPAVCFAQDGSGDSAMERAKQEVAKDNLEEKGVKNPSQEQIKEEAKKINMNDPNDPNFQKVTSLLEQQASAAMASSSLPQLPTPSMDAPAPPTTNIQPQAPSGLSAAERMQDVNYVPQFGDVRGPYGIPMRVNK